MCIRDRYTCDDSTGTNLTDSVDEPKRKSKLAAFLISFFVGMFGGDWFFLSKGDGGYIVAGVFKLLTLGGVGIW